MKRLARRLRTIADIIDPAGAPRYISEWSFTFEEGKGMVFRRDGRGCRLAYLGHDDYAKAHDEAGLAPLPPKRVEIIPLEPEAIITRRWRRK